MRSLSLPLGLAALALCAACASEQPSGPLVEDVRFFGRQHFENSELDDGLRNHAPEGIWPFDSLSYLDPLALELDRRRVESFYTSEGYFSAFVGQPSTRPGEEGGVRIDYRVQPGRQSKLVSVELRGLPPAEPGLTEPALQALIAAHLKQGKGFRYADYEAAKGALLDRLLRHGYAHATVSGEARVERRAAEVRVVFTMKPGPLCYFGRTEISTERVPADSIRARIAWEEGQRYDPALLEKTESRMYELQLVGSVSFKLPSDPKQAVLDVVVTVHDGDKNELRLGGGFAHELSENIIRLRAGYTRRDLFHPLWSFDSELKPWVRIEDIGTSDMNPQLEARASLRREDAFFYRLTARLQGSYARLKYEAYTIQQLKGGPSFDRPIFDDRLRWRLSLWAATVAFPSVDDQLSAADYERAGIPSCDNCEYGVEPDAMNVYAIAPVISFDGRDNAAMPTSGFFLQLKSELGFSAAGRSDRYLKLTPEARAYVSLGPRLVFATRLRFGTVAWLRGRIPATQRYFGGGAESQRGFTLRHLSPYAGSASDPMPIGGEAEVEGSVELRWLLTKIWGSWFGVVGFLDAGDVTEHVSEIDPLKLHLAIGPGLRYHTPVGPIRLDVGFRITRTAPGETATTSKWAFHLSLGEAF